MFILMTGETVALAPGIFSKAAPAPGFFLIGSGSSSLALYLNVLDFDP